MLQTNLNQYVFEICSKGLMRSLGSFSKYGSWSQHSWTLSKENQFKKLVWENPDSTNFFSYFSDLQPENIQIRFAYPGFENYIRKGLRFDFLKEWNNEGYGAISRQGPWGLGSPKIFNQGTKLAQVFDDKGQLLSDFLVLFDDPNGSTLWCLRPTGIFDGPEIRILEDFFSDYRHPDLFCIPVLSEIPFGYEGSLSFRIDCDEAISSGRPLFELYKTYEIPFGLAIKTNQPLQKPDRDLISDVLNSGGSVVSHSHTHAPNWGNSALQAKKEVMESHSVLQSLDQPLINYDWVVSPFHQNSIEVVQGLQETLIKGFVSGIICNDPEYLISRGGPVPFVSIKSQSQQCMFHGDTYHCYHNSIAHYEWCLTLSTISQNHFGYLDHPFSNYWYGWKNEEERLSAHFAFLNSQKKFNLWKPSLTQALDFMDWKTAASFEWNSYQMNAPRKPHSLPPQINLCVRFRGSKVLTNEL